MSNLVPATPTQPVERAFLRPCVFSGLAFHDDDKPVVLRDDGLGDVEQLKGATRCPNRFGQSGEAHVLRVKGHIEKWTHVRSNRSVATGTARATGSATSTVSAISAFSTVPARAGGATVTGPTGAARATAATAAFATIRTTAPLANGRGRTIHPRETGIRSCRNARSDAWSAGAIGSASRAFEATAILALIVRTIAAGPLVTAASAAALFGLILGPLRAEAEAFQFAQIELVKVLLRFFVRRLVVHAKTG